MILQAARFIGELLRMSMQTLFLTIGVGQVPDTSTIEFHFVSSMDLVCPRSLIISGLVITTTTQLLKKHLKITTWI